jgi:hypothetical protein
MSLASVVEKLVPVIVTDVPTFPLVGEKEAMVGTCEYIFEKYNTKRVETIILRYFDIYFGGRLFELLVTF